MPIPTVDELLRPVLALAAKEEITRRSANAAMIKAFGLTEEEQKECVPSGGTRILGRTGWAMTFLTKPGLIEKVGKYSYRATEAGRRFLETHPEKITDNDLKAIPGYREAWEAGRRRRAEARARKEGESAANATESSTTPEELIGEACETLEQSLRSDLLEQLGDVDPYRFEQIVIDLLFAMGYGGSREEAAQITKKSGDEGIDGIINEDRLGLDVVYVQAKRWKGTVGRTEIQNFVGALAGQKANKGVFITTSDFASSAIEYAKSVQQKVILINGQRLAELMIEHGIGVSTIRNIAIKRIDSDYFEEG